MASSGSTETGREQGHQPVTVCVFCGAKLQADDLVKHIQERHCAPAAPGAAKDTQKPVQKLATKKPAAKHVDVVPDDDPEYEFLEGDIETITDEFYDELFGDKYVGQSWPESSGQLGSLPLYDDYGDEGAA